MKMARKSQAWWLVHAVNPSTYKAEKDRGKSMSLGAAWFTL